MSPAVRQFPMHQTAPILMATACKAVHRLGRKGQKTIPKPDASSISVPNSLIAARATRALNSSKPSSFPGHRQTPFRAATNGRTSTLADGPKIGGHHTEVWGAP
jgi:hypothetical protein